MTAFLFLMLVATSAHAAAFAEHVHLTTPPQKPASLLFESPGGVQHMLGDYRGHYVLLNLWATWCGPCVREMPSLDALQARFPVTQLTVLPVSEDRGDAMVSAFYQRHGIAHLPVLIDPAGVAPSALKIRGLPTSLLIDPQGMEVARIEGDIDWTAPDVLTFLISQMRRP